MYLYVRGIDFASFYNFGIGFWNCFNNIVFFVFILLSLEFYQDYILQRRLSCYDD